jgi:hypothetical protein
VGAVRAINTERRRAVRRGEGDNMTRGKCWGIEDHTGRLFRNVCTGTVWAFRSRDKARRHIKAARAMGSYVYGRARAVKVEWTAKGV